MNQFPKFSPAWNSTGFGHFLCPSSGVYSLYTRHWYMSYRFEDSFRAGPGLILVIMYSWLSGMQEHMLLHTRQSAIQNNKYQSWSCSKAIFKPVWHIPVPSVQWINFWWWAEEISETCRVSCRRKFEKLFHLICFIMKKFFTMHGDINKNFHKYH